MNKKALITGINGQDNPKIELPTLGVILSITYGFFADMRGTIAALYECDRQDIMPYVNWNNSIYKEPKYGENVWEYYFEQIGDQKIKNKIRVPQSRAWKRETFARKRMVDMINKYVIIKSHILEKVDSFWGSNVKEDDKVLGIHLRMTDKFNCHKHSEPITGKPIDVDVYIKHIKKYIEKEGENVKIFLATDSIDGIEKITSTFGDKLFYVEDAIRSSGVLSIHQHLKGVSNYKKGLDVLMDSLLLSKCNFLFKGISNVSLGSLFFNENLKQFNLNQYYNKDMRESFIEQNLTYA